MAEPTSTEENKLFASVLDFLEKNNLRETADVLRQEAKRVNGQPKDAPTMFSSDLYTNEYSKFIKFVANSEEPHNFELELLLYPVFAHMYLELVFNGCLSDAQALMNRFRDYQKSYYQGDVAELSSFVNVYFDADRRELVDCLRNNKFVVRLSPGANRDLRKFFLMEDSCIVKDLVSKYMILDVVQCGLQTEEVINATTGYVLGEATSIDNAAKVFYSLLPEPSGLNEMSGMSDSDMADDSENHTPKRKKLKVSSKKRKHDPNAPSLDRMPMLPLRDADRLRMSEARRESKNLLPLNDLQLPSICCVTILDRMYEHKVTCTTFSEDLKLLIIGTFDAQIIVHSLRGNCLLKMKPTDELNDIDPESDDVLVRMVDLENAKLKITLRGHSGTIYGTSLGRNDTMLLSCSGDTTVRLWSLQIWCCLVVYKGHMVPVWDIQFAPYGYFFATASNDKSARLWSTDQHVPVRVFAGHFSDVSCLKFHPNGNYIATGSNDRSVRMWDCVTGLNVRLLTGHKGDITSLQFSNSGQYLASGSFDQAVYLWNIPTGELLSVLKAHTGSICCLAFSQDDNVLASGSNDWTVKLWDMKKIKHDMEQNVESLQIHDEDSKILLGSYRTKATSILGLQFGRTNCLMAAGRFENVSRLTEFYR